MADPTPLTPLPTAEEEVERIYEVFKEAIPKIGGFDAAHGVNAVLLFALRFSQAMLHKVPKEMKVGEAQKISRGFMKAGAMLEFEQVQESKELVH